MRPGQSGEPERYAPGENCLIDVKGEQIVVHHAERITLDLHILSLGARELPDRDRGSMKVMRFTLVDEPVRTFRVQRWCLRGSIGLGMPGSEVNLGYLVRKFGPHIGEDSFFESM